MIPREEIIEYIKARELEGASLIDIRNEVRDILDRMVSTQEFLGMMKDVPAP